MNPKHNPLEKNIKNEAEINSNESHDFTESTQGTHETQENIEAVLERAEKTLEEIENLDSQIEERGIKAIEEGGNPALIEKHKQVLEKLEKEKESFLKKLSRELAGYTKKQIASFRDKRLQVNARNSQNSIENHKVLSEYGNAFRRRDTDKTKALEKKAQAAFERKYKSMQSLLANIEEGEWGSSKHGKDTATNINNFLFELASTGVSLEREEEPMRVLSIYENSELLRSSRSRHFDDVVKLIAKEQGEKIGNNPTQEKIEEVCKNNPFLIAEQISGTSFVNGRDTSFFEKQIDTLIEKYPDGGSLSNKARELFQKALQANPEKYALDPANRHAMFGVLTAGEKSGINLSDDTIKSMWLMAPELKDLSPEDVKLVIENFGSYKISEKAPQSFLASLPLDTDSLQALYKRLNPQAELSKGEYSPEHLLDLLKNNTTASQGTQIAFMHFDKFNLDPANRLAIFKDIVSDIYNETSFPFLVNILARFDEVFEGLPENEYAETLNKLIERSAGVDAEKIRGLYALIPEYNVPSQYKEKIAQTFASNYGGRAAGKVLGLNQGTQKELSREEEWLKGRGELLPHLEVQFYSSGEMNDVRHFFYEVLDGRRQAADPDALIRAFAKRSYEIGPEEFLNLFFIGKKIDKSYLPVFLPLLKDTDRLWGQIQDSIRLNQISKEDYNEILTEGIKTAPFDFAEQTLSRFLENENLTPTQKTGALRDYFNNIFNSPAGNLENIGYDKIYLVMQDQARHGRLSVEERQSVVKGYFEGMLQQEKLHPFIIQMLDLRGQDLFANSFNETEKKEFAKKLMQTNNPLAMSELIQDYFGEARMPKAEHALCSNIELEDAQTLFQRATALDNLDVDRASVASLAGLTPVERQLFLDTLLAKQDIFTDRKKRTDDSSVKAFCEVAANAIQRERNEKKEGRNITPEYAQALFGKIFESSRMGNDILSTLSSYQMPFLVGDRVIFDQFVEAVNKKGATGTGMYLLELATTEKAAALSRDQVESLSKKVLVDRNLDGKMYEMYRTSTPDQLKFYLDSDLFQASVSRIVENKNNSSSLNVSGVLEFLAQQRVAQGANETLTLTPGQEEAVAGRLIGDKGVTSSNIDALFAFDSTLFRNSYKKGLAEKTISPDAYSQILFASDEIARLFPEDAIQYAFSQGMPTSRYFEKICQHFAADPQFLKEIKKLVSDVSDDDNRSWLQSELLQRDLFEPEELRGVYENIQKRSDVRSSVLECAELLGSLAVAKQPEKMKDFFAQGDKEVAEKIENISSFVKKYSLENKGRTIAVMLFAKEYLPDRSPEEVVKKVAEQLAKHERVLDQYKYEGIPDGLRGSIGFEYEITHSTADGYRALTSRDLKRDIVRLSKAAHIGSGRDAVHEVANRPAVNPYLMLLEVQLLNDIEYIDFNFDRSPEYQKGSRGYHMTIGGEHGLEVNANMQFLQNSILAASWGGIHAGETGKRVSGGRGVTLRGRPPKGNNNVQVFDKPTPSVEMRSLSVDKMEPFQRSVVTAYNGAIAIQALEKYTNQSSDTIVKWYKEKIAANGNLSEKDFMQSLRDERKITESPTDPKVEHILYAWTQLVSDFQDAVEYHNTDFLDGETMGYMDKDQTWVEAATFGGEYNKKRFESIVFSIDPTLSVDEYVKSTSINFNSLFSSFDRDFSDSLTKINNLYLKPAAKTKDELTGRGGAGDQANAMAMLDITKLDNETLERRDDPEYLHGTVFDTLGQKREGYYNVQGASERMLTHAAQRALLSFNKKMESIVNA